MRITGYTLTGAGAANNATYMALAAATAGVAMTLTGAAAAISPPREITLTSGADASATIYDVTGTDKRGCVITEAITGPATATVRGRKVFASITSIIPRTSNAATVSAGNAQRVPGSWIGVNLFASAEFVPTMKTSTEIISGAPAGQWEFTHENVTQISGEGAFVDGVVASTPAAAGDTAAVQGAYVRYVVTSAAGSLKTRFVRPSF